uniref:Uncharacterized protein n=1 Tax=Aegilops tauschii TaxID=37682 RepID=M8CSE1_AEGTA|nr:uncharacterized protein LOC109767289 [Aegilops tauschii subsp. strangulata]
MASPSPSFLLQLVRYVWSLPSQFMGATARALPASREGAGAAIRPSFAAPAPQRPGAPAEGAGGQGGIIHEASPVPLELMHVAARAAPPMQGAGGNRTHPRTARLMGPQRPGAPKEGAGGRGGIIHAASS